MPIAPEHPDTLVASLRAAGCVFAEEEAELLRAEAVDAAALARWSERRIAGEPLEYILGWAAFCGLRVGLEPGVFIPRQRTAFLAEQAAALLSPGRVAVDLCCGSGAIALVLAASGATALYAADLDPAAVRCARRNLGGSAIVSQGDLFEALPPALRGRIDVVAANVPYVPTEAIATMPVEARDYEPTWTHDGGADGLAVAARVAREAASWLAPGGCLVIETSESQVGEAGRLFAAAGLEPRVIRSDEAEAAVVAGTRPSEER